MFLLSYYIGKEKCDVMYADIRSALKTTVAMLNIPDMKGVPINRIDTHSLRGSSANALSLSRYCDREI